MPFFSIIVPLYNKETFVVNAIQSILVQSFQDFEVLVVDDGSTDRSLELVSQIKSSLVRIIKHDSNKGLSAARNTGIQNAEGAHIAFLDADDCWKPEYLSTIHQLIHDYPETQLWATNYEELYVNQVVIVNQNPLFKKDETSVVSDFFQCNLGKPIYFPSSLCVAKSVFDRVGFYDERITYAEDVDFNIRANTQFKLAYANKALVTYTLFSENQITNSTFHTKVLPNFSNYEIEMQDNLALQKYVDFNRYIFARNYKYEKAWEQFDRLRQEICPRNLNYKQRILLDAPLFLLKWVKQLKNFGIQKGVLLTTYR